MNAARLSLCLIALAFKSSRSRLPSGNDFTGTTLRPAMTADYAIMSKTRKWEEINTYSRVRSVGTDRDQADVTVSLTPRLMIRSNDRQTSILAGGP